MRNFKVAVSDNPPPSSVNDLDDYNLCGQFSGIPDPTGTITCPRNMKGRFVYVYVIENTFLTLCEVEVYGKLVYIC